MAIRTILVALALDEDSRKVADRAVQLANDHDAQLVGVHVLESMHLHQPGLPPSVDPDALAASIRDERAARLGTFLEATKRPAVTEVATGKPYAEIGALAASHDADLIVIGPGGARNLRGKVFGSTADRIVRCAPCPVLVVRNPDAVSYRHIAVGVDFSDHARAAAAFASTLAPSALRVLIHVTEIPLAFEQAMLEAGTTQQEIERYRVASARAARRKILDMLDESGRLPTSTRVRIVRGDPAAALVNVSRRGRSDLVAVGTQGANALARHLLGSVARKVLAGSKSDVLVMPSTAI